VKKISTGAIIRFDHEEYFSDKKTIFINCTGSDVLEGNKKEVLKITFDWDKFITKTGTKLLTLNLETNPNSNV